jgi:adenine-specific DNA-methyltransferase
MSTELENTENLLENIQSHDWNKERLAQLKTLMPDLFTNEGQLNINELKKVIDPSLVTETERYEFRWFGKSNAKREAFAPTDATLVYDEHRSVNPTESENIIIEGENLAVLKLLSNSYRQQVKCIFIDPPYNTGKDFVYSDKFNQNKKEYWEDAEVTENGFKIDTNTETDGRFHSNWLNMMYSRLLIARQLLKEDGVIFISIDDNEVHHLRKLCDEVFGEENFINEFIWRNGRTSSAIYTKEQEYILAYGKSVEVLSFIKYDGENEIISDRAIKKIGVKNPASDIFFPKGIRFESEDKTFPNNFGDTESVEVVKGQLRCENKLLAEDVVLKAGWVMKDMIEDWIDKQDVIDSKGQKVSEFYFKENGILQYIKEKGTIHPKTIIENFSTKSGTNELTKLMGVKVFDYPKPVKLLKFISIILDKNDTVLDFFAGSGTTGQAIAELNQEDGGNRKYILVQLPEATDDKSEAYKAGYKKISDITIERNKRVVAKIEKDIAEEEEKKKGELALDESETSNTKAKRPGFKVFKLQKSNFPRVDYAPDPEKTHEDNVEALKKYIRDKEAQLISAFNKEELITEILLKNGFKLNYTLTKQETFTKNEILFATDGDKETLVCLDGDLAEETVDYFKKNTEQKLIVLERALDTTKKWNLKHYMKDNFKAF